MTALLYFIVAVLAVSLPMQTWLADRDDPARQAFLALGWAMGLAYGAFALSLLPGLAELRVVYTTAGCFVPGTLLWTVDRFFDRGDRLRSRWLPIVFIGAALVGPSTAIAHLGFYLNLPRSSPPEVVAGAYAIAAFGVVLFRLWEAHELVVLPVEKTRLRYLLLMIGAAIVFTILEQLARSIGAPVDAQALSLASRGVALQGAIPPFSVVLAGLALYFLFHSVVAYRLLDLQELFSKAAILVGSASLLVLIDGITFMWVDTFTVYPFHSTFQIFLASMVFLAAYDPLRGSISFLAHRTLNQRGFQFTEALTHLRSQIPSVTSTETLVGELLDPLVASGRVPRCSVYLWDRHLDGFRFAGARGESVRKPLQIVMTRPFTEGFAEGKLWYARADVKRRARSDPEQLERLAMMQAMDADLTVPFMSGGAVLGWIHLRHERWSDGFSREEMHGLSEVAGLASVVLSNIRDFKVLEQAHRLAALGRMAAGLAHEIRNPLAGVKGAAQYLEGDNLPDESKEMLQVIIDEVDRLDIVVSQFLDYARPFELRRSSAHVNAIVVHALTVVRAQGVHPDVKIIEDFSGELPLISMDQTRLTQVLLNLLQNGLQAMPEGGVLTVRTRVRTLQGLSQLEIVVEDTGSGIAWDDLEHLFIPFFTTKAQGTGLGLPICERIIEAHGGEIDVHSQEGQGATFLVRLPLAHVAATP